MIAQIVSEVFERIGHTWSFTNADVRPDENLVQQMLDRAAGALYDRDVTDRYEVAGLIIEKAPDGHDVYVYVGNYK